MSKKNKDPSRTNPVAKNMEKFNRPATHKDKKNDYKRNDKHKGRKFDPYFLAVTT